MKRTRGFREVPVWRRQSPPPPAPAMSAAAAAAETQRQREREAERERSGYSSRCDRIDGVIGGETLIGSRGELARVSSPETR